ncbi:MAG: phosphoglycerate dehydrogenase, partial [Anaerolineae bacterium]|nr:phosphoglycerate dehydrogenase [Anaerolineae bacterium]
MPLFEIAVATDLTEEGLNLLRGEGDLRVAAVRPARREVSAALTTAHALIARDDLSIDAALLADAPRLRVIGRVGASLNGIDIDAAS